MGQYAVGVQIHPHVWYFDVGFPYPGGAMAAKGWGVHSLKWIMSWVQTAVRQVGFYLHGLCEFDSKLAIVRKETADDANGMWVIWEGTLRSYAFRDKHRMHLRVKLN